jgi:hypothetical protein
VHLFHAELHTLAIGETRVRWAVRAGGLTFSLRDSRKELYPPCTMTSNNAEWERGWFYLRNDGADLPLHQKGVEGEDRRLASRRIASLASVAAGGGFNPGQPPPPASHPPHGEGAPHL